MGLFDKKSTTKTTNTEYTTDSSVHTVDNKVVGDNSNVGGNISAQNINGNVTNTDYGAIAEGTGLSKAALDFASNNVANAFTFADSALEKNTLFGDRALDSVDYTNKLANQVTGVALDKLYEGNKNALSFGSNAVEQLRGTADNAINKVTDVVKAANTSDSVQTIKYIGYAVVGIAIAIFVAPSLIKALK